MGAILETVDIQHEAAKAPRQVRISRNVKAAIDLMVHEGQKRSEAAQSAGITDDALRKAMLKPEVRAYRNTQMGVIRESAASRTIARAEMLMDSAESEHVRLDATKWIGGLEGIVPVQRTESTINHRGIVGPGLTIVLVPPNDRVIAHQSSQPQIINGDRLLPSPVPHPGAGNASRQAQNLRGSRASGEQVEGEKS